MAHEIYEDDNVVLHGERAWHGLGVIVQDAPTPAEALKMAGLDIGVDRRELFFYDSLGQPHKVESHVANVRADNGRVLGVVTDGYQTIQNIDTANFCAALADESNGAVKCETIGSIRHGAKVWFLLKGEQFSVANGDGIFPYILVSNGHDGLTTFRVTPTTVRVVCSNTMHMVIPRYETGELGSSAISIRHTVNIMERIEEARLALKHYRETLDEQKIMADVMSRKQVSQADVQQFFLDCYTADFGEIPQNPTSKVEENRKNRAMSAYNSFSRRFDDERGIAGSSWWNTVNAYSGLCQHDLKARGQDDEDRVEKRVTSNLFGLNANRTQDALQRAFRQAVGVAV